MPLCLCPFVPSAPLALHTIPPEDPAVYDMICRADTIGVFQIESRAQMSMLPRLRPRCFYDLVIEVAIVRPGPIQGDMVHPYLRRRNGEEPVAYPHPDVQRILGKTLGIPLFQEQAMRLAIVAGGFTPGEADELRRAMAAWRRSSNAIERFGDKLIRGMLERGYRRDFAQRCFEQIKGFSEYGFPESHAASFALIVYASAWLKRYHPAAFAAALLNSQPMGFYAPAQIVRDAREHGVEVRKIDVNRSQWACGLEEKRSRDEEMERRSGREGQRDEGTEAQRDERMASGEPGEVGPAEADHPSMWGRDGPALRLGMRLVRGLGRGDADAIVRAVREHGPFVSIEALRRACGVSVSALRHLARADAFGSMGLDRHQALWRIRLLRDGRPGLFARSEDRPAQGVNLPERSMPERVRDDYAAVGLSLRAHPVRFIRDRLNRLGVSLAGALRDEQLCPHGRRIAVAGIVLVRQRPATASGVVFMTIEDETGIANLIVMPRIYQRDRAAARHSRILLARGTIERQGQVVHVRTDRIESLDDPATPLLVRSRDFH